MIYPARPAILAALAGAPIALAIAGFLPGLWYIGLIWSCAVLLLVAVDGALGPRPATARAEIELPGTASVGTAFEALAKIHFDAEQAPSSVEVALGMASILEATKNVEIVQIDGRHGTGHFEVTPLRRGTAHFPRIWIRWRGPFGLAWKQRVINIDAGVAVLPDIETAHRRAGEIFRRHALQGLLLQIDRGDGTDFDTLTEYKPGMDKRAIDWKQSARHIKLHAKEFRTERNNQIVFAIDAGRQMSDPIAGLPRLDRAVSAMLQNAWISLKLGDRAALFSFDSRPRLASGFVAGTRAFGELQRLAAQIDYSSEEPNYTFALATLSRRLKRRSMVVLITEFTDLTAADFLIDAVSRLMRKHLLMIVVLRDEDLEAFASHEPVSTDDVTRAVTAAALLRERLLVLTRLRHLGVNVVESEHDRLGDRITAAYLDLKRRNLL